MGAKNARRKRRCKQKKSYTDKARAVNDALAVQAKLRRRASGKKVWPIRAYRCQICGQWHVGHQPKRHKTTNRKLWQNLGTWEGQIQ